MVGCAVLLWDWRFNLYLILLCFLVALFPSHEPFWQQVLIMLDFQLSHTTVRQFRGLLSLYCGSPAPLIAALMSSYGFGGLPLNSPKKIKHTVWDKSICAEWNHLPSVLFNCYSIFLVLDGLAAVVFSYCDVLCCHDCICHCLSEDKASTTYLLKKSFNF